MFVTPVMTFQPLGFFFLGTVALEKCLTWNNHSNREEIVLKIKQDICTSSTNEIVNEIQTLFISRGLIKEQTQQRVKCWWYDSDKSEILCGRLTKTLLL